MSGGATFYVSPLNHADYTVTGEKVGGHGPPAPPPPVSDAYAFRKRYFLLKIDNSTNGIYTRGILLICGINFVVYTLTTTVRTRVTLL